MEEIGAAKIQIREDISQRISALSESQIAEKTMAIEARLFEFANFLESKIALLYFTARKQNLFYCLLTQAILRKS